MFIYCLIFLFVMKFEMHAHTKYSYDSILSVKSLMKIAKRKGLDGVAITDHNSIKAHKEAKKYSKRNDLKFIPGVEIKSTKGDFLCYNIREMPSSKKPLEILDFVKKRGGFCAIAHPLDFHRVSCSFYDKTLMKSLVRKNVFLELNARSLPKSVKKVLSFGKEINAKFIAGSDSHFFCEVGRNITELDSKLNVKSFDFKSSYFSLMTSPCSFMIKRFRKLFK